MPKKLFIGLVTSDKMDKTRRVEISRLEKHAKYGKYIKRKTVCITHDENNESKKGDLVEIEESRPMSKMKRWNLVRIVEKGEIIDISALRAAAQSK